MSSDNPEGKKPVFKQKVGDQKGNLLPIEKIDTVHIDRALVAVDYSTQTATITCLTMHAIPKFSGEFGIEDYSYELVGELKVPFTAMDALCAYYLSTRTKDREGLYESIKKFMAEPPADDPSYIRYGPTAMK